MDCFVQLNASLVSIIPIRKLSHALSRVYGEKSALKERNAKNQSDFLDFEQKKEWEVFWSYLAFFSPSALAMKTTIE